MSVYAFLTRVLLGEREFGALRIAWQWFRHGQAQALARAIRGPSSPAERKLIMAEVRGCPYGPIVTDVWLSERHPQLRSRLRCNDPFLGRSAKVMRRLAFTGQAAGSVVATVGDAGMVIVERLRARHKGRQILAWRLEWNYWRGVAPESRTREYLRSLSEPADGIGSPAIDVDLHRGLAWAEAQLDAARPVAADLWHHDVLVAEIPRESARERLHGGHLRAILRDRAADLGLAMLVSVTDRIRERIGTVALDDMSIDRNPTALGTAHSPVSRVHLHSGADGCSGMAK